MVAHVKALRLRSLDVTSLNSKPRLRLASVRLAMRAHHSALKQRTRRQRLARSKVRGSRVNLGCRRLVRQAPRKCRVFRLRLVQPRKPRNSV